MQFVSLSFLLLLSGTLLAYYLLPKRTQWWVLLLASYVFYFFAGAECLIFILFTTAVTYLTALWLQKRADRETAYLTGEGASLSKEERKAFRGAQKKRRFRILILGLFLGLGVLAVLKYTGFVVSGLQAWGANVRVPDLLLPLGISFYTFQSMGYLIDVYRGKGRAEKNPFKLALFVAFFPQLLQGPISRFGDLAPQLYAEHRFDGATFRAGALRVMWGYFKKMVIADTAMIAVKTIVNGADGGKTPLTGVYVFFLILLYSAVIYGDFTGGIDITIGIAEMLGIGLKENFDRPFASRSVKEFWRRWHITMGTWFSDYVFYPLSVCNPMQRFSKWSRKHLGNAIGKRLPVYIATVVTWFLTGLWHGAGWNFIVWGLLNCLVILVSQELQPLWKLWQQRAPRVAASQAWGIFQATRTFLLMGLIRTLDCYRDVPLTFRRWGSMFTTFNFGEFFGGGFLNLGLSLADWIVLGVAILAVLVVTQIGKTQPLRKRLSASPVLFAACMAVGICVVLIFGTYGIGYDAGDFIYVQF